MNQLEKILEITGKPSDEDIEAINSSFAATMLNSLPTAPKKDIKVLMKDAPPEAVDMVIKLMDFNPARRLDIDGALAHPYMKAFVTGQEQNCPGKLSIPIDDDYKFTVNDY